MHDWWAPVTIFIMCECLWTCVCRTKYWVNVGEARQSLWANSSSLTGAEPMPDLSDQRLPAEWRVDRVQVVGKRWHTLCPIYSPPIAPDYITRPHTDMMYLPPSHPLSHLPLPPRGFLHEPETDNSGTYGGQEVMQINVSQHQYFLALQSPCREEVRGPTEYNWASAD